MIDKRIIEVKLRNQKALSEEILRKPFLKRFLTRHIALDHDLLFLSGVRGCGKSTLALNVMKNAAVQYAYVDLEDFKYVCNDESGFNALLEALYIVYGTFEWIVIDEFNAISEWETLICLLRTMGFKIAAIASGNIGSKISHGIGVHHVLYPLSFSEYCIWHEIPAEAKTPQLLATLRSAFDDYMLRGGFPSNQFKTRIKSNASRLFKAIAENDLHGDVRKMNQNALIRFAEFLVRESPVNAILKDLASHFSLRSENTAKKYLSIIKDSACAYPLERFAFKKKQRNYCERVFAVDPAFCKDVPENRLKAIVYMQLHRFCTRHGYHMHYYGNRELECDFALCHDMRMRTIIQIIYDYSDSTLVKEKVAGLIALAKATGCTRLYILTDNCHDTIETKGLKIFVKPAYEFLLDKSHMIIENTGVRGNFQHFS